MALRSLFRGVRAVAAPSLASSTLRIGACATVRPVATSARSVAVRARVVSVPAARAMSTAVEANDEAAAIIAATTKPKPSVVISQSIYKSVILDVPIDVAWNGIRAFAGTWIPDSVIALAPDHASDGKDNIIGHARIVTVVPLKKRLVEQLVGYNDLKKAYTYRTLAVEDGIFPAPFWNYVGTVRLYEVTEGAKTLATWTANYETAPGALAATLAGAIGDGTLATNLKMFNDYLVKQTNSKANKSK